MGRFLSPVLFLGAGYYVLWFNKTHTGSVLLFPGIPLVYPEAAGDPALQGRITGYGFLAFGALLLLRAIVSYARSRGEQDGS